MVNKNKKKFVFASDFENLKNKIAKQEGLVLEYFDNLVIQQNGKIVDSFYFKDPDNCKFVLDKTKLVNYINNVFNRDLGWGYHFNTCGCNLILDFAKDEENK